MSANPDLQATPANIAELRSTVDLLATRTIVAYSLNTSEEYNLARLGEWANRECVDPDTALLDSTQEPMFLTVRSLTNRRMRQL